MALALLATVSSAFANPPGNNQRFALSRGKAGFIAPADTAVNQPRNNQRRGGRFALSRGKAGFIAPAGMVIDREKIDRAEKEEGRVIKKDPIVTREYHGFARSTESVNPKFTKSGNSGEYLNPLDALGRAKELMETPRSDSHASEKYALADQMFRDLADWCLEIVKVNDYNYLNNDIVTITEFFLAAGCTHEGHGKFYSISFYQAIFLPAVVKTVINIANSMMEDISTTNTYKEIQNVNYLVRLAYAMVYNYMTVSDAPELMNQIGIVLRKMAKNSAFLSIMRTNYPTEYAYVAGFFSIK